MSNNPLFPIIARHVQLPNAPSKKGWYRTLCKVCHDRGKKGLRGGFQFDQTSIKYHCFNCDHSAKYNIGGDITDNFNKVLISFNIPREDIVNLDALPAMLGAQQQTRRVISLIHHKPGYIPPEPIKIPDTFILLDRAGDIPLAKLARSYLIDQRAIDPNSYPFYICIGGQLKTKRYEDRLIIPYYRNDQLVYFQARALKNQQPKYLDCDVSRDNIIYGFDFLNQDLDKPLYITEGWFDAFHINGVSVFTFRITEQQLQLLIASVRPKVVIPDKFGENSYKLGQTALDHDWGISCPDFGEAKDVNEAIVKYGKIYTMQSIYSHTYSGFAASIQLSMYCEDDRTTAITQHFHY